MNAIFTANDRTGTKQSEMKHSCITLGLWFRKSALFWKDLLHP